MDANQRSRAAQSSCTRLLLSALLGLALMAPAGHAVAASPASPPQGVYDECPPSDAATCVPRVQRVGGAGFKVIVNYQAWEGTADDILAYAGAASAAGVQVIWPFNDAAWRHGGLLRRYPQLAGSCDCSTDDGLRSYAVGLVKDLPATWGYYVGDELAATELPSANLLATAVKALDPGHQTLYVANGNNARLGGDVTPFAGVADVVGADSYPYGLGGDSSTVSTVGQNVLRATRAKQRVAVLQSFDWSAYPSESGVTTERWPTVAEMRAAKSMAVMSSSPSLVLWYSLHDIERSADPGRHWRDLVSAAFPPAKARKPARATRPRAQKPRKRSVIRKQQAARRTHGV